MIKNFNTNSEWYKIAEKIKENGFEVYIVGGAVRDMLKNKNPSDYDLVTNATTQELFDIFKNSFQAGTQFQTNLINNVEVSTYRGGSIIEDLEHRDLTINAMAMNPFTGVILDPFNGMIDLQNSVIKLVRDPNERIHEDPLRILRVARFASIMGPECYIDFETDKVIERNYYLLSTVAKERFFKEIMKALSDSPKPSLFFKLIEDYKLIYILFGPMVYTVNFNRGKYNRESVWKHSIDTADNLKAPLTKDNELLILAGFLHDIGMYEAFFLNNDESFRGHDIIGVQKVKEILTKNKFPNYVIDYVSDAIQLHTYPINSLRTKKGLKKFLYVLEKCKSSFSLIDYLNLSIADRKANRGVITDQKIYNIKEEIIELFFDIKKNNEAFKIKDLKINGFDLQKDLNIQPGPIIGDILETLLSIVINNPEKNEYNQLIKIAEEMICEKTQENWNCENI